jgi:8-oxo-dGTP pyrophosphatase MutT (NUDIX family)
MPVVRPRKAASLILLRETPRGTEVLMGRRGAGARFMPGNYVFPGGVVQPSDGRPFAGEPPDSASLGLDALVRARAALRETFEETGVLLARPMNGTTPAGALGCWPDFARACSEGAVEPALGSLRLIARAITPPRSPMRFHAYFFLADGALVLGEAHAAHELEDVAWHAVAHSRPVPMSDVTQFMLERALAVWRGEGAPAAPLYHYRRDAATVTWPKRGDGQR